MSDSDAILAANAAYYRAFASGDFATMSSIWADDGVSC
ncbi:MAG TPA: nuclear transport factor 2 family protein, partial [Xanthobacteraceae bacterium]|nr:nuclear transport factor 2 family protein [Xanthobacteraceae bacterium]